MIEELKKLAEKAENVRFEEKENESHRIKYALVLPFIRALGYDIFDPEEVEPGFEVIGDDRSETVKLDYVICPAEKARILVMMARPLEEGSMASPEKLRKAFSSSGARVAMYTDGIRYRFFSDLDEKGQMDQMPYLTMDLRKLKDPADQKKLIEELRWLSKGEFDIKKVGQKVFKKRLYDKVSRYLSRQTQKADPEFIRFIYRQVYDKPLNEEEQEIFKKVVRDVARKCMKSTEHEGRSTSGPEKEREDIEETGVGQPKVESEGMKEDQTIREVPGNRESSKGSGYDKQQAEREERSRKESVQKQDARNTSGKDVLDRDRIRRQRRLTGTNLEENSSTVRNGEEPRFKYIEGQGKSRKDGGYEVFSEIINNVTHPERFKIQDRDGKLILFAQKEKDMDRSGQPLACLYYRDSDNLTLVLYDASNEEYKIPLKNLQEIYDFSDQIEFVAEKS